MLRVFGIGDLGERIYRRLVGTASATAAELAEFLPARLEEVERELSGLVAQGLVLDTGVRPRRFFAAPPDTAVESLLLRRQAELTEARGELDLLVRDYRDARRVRGSEEVIEIVAGAEALTQRVVQLQRAARFRFDGFVKPPYVAIGFEDAEALVNPDVSYRTIYDQAVLEYPDFVKRVRSSAAANDESRMNAELPMKLMIVDDTAAMLPLVRGSAHESPSAVVVHASGLLDALIALFDHYWAASVPLLLDDGAADAGTPVGDDRRILSLLLVGATDATVARQLDISVRTVQRRVTEMMATAGVGTRIQLGRHAAERGWV